MVEGVEGGLAVDGEGLRARRVRGRRAGSARSRPGGRRRRGFLPPRDDAPPEGGPRAGRTDELNQALAAVTRLIAAHLEAIEDLKLLRSTLAHTAIQEAGDGGGWPELPGSPPPRGEGLGEGGR